MQGTATQALKKGPLEGIVVLDFSRVLAGPYCTMVLADLGARVIKIEKLGSGDDTRAFGPFVDGESAYFMCFNRGKESIALDIKSPRDRELLERLLDRADVVVENFRPGVMDRLGYGAERLAKTHPHIVYASISGFGHTGPFSDLPGYDMVVQAMGALTRGDQLWRSRCRAFRYRRHRLRPLQTCAKRTGNARRHWNARLPSGADGDGSRAL
jgi:CoA:oxalate CoA-transferase